MAAKILSVPAIGLILLLVAGLAFGQGQPPKEVLVGKIAESIPAYWSVADITVTASVSSGLRQR